MTLFISVFILENSIILQEILFFYSLILCLKYFYYYSLQMSPQNLTEIMNIYLPKNKVMKLKTRINYYAIKVMSRLNLDQNLNINLVIKLIKFN